MDPAKAGCNNPSRNKLGIRAFNMGKYTASPFGDITGKLGDAVGAKWKGKHWVRKRVNPKQRGTLDMYKLVKAGLIAPDNFSFRQMNIEKVILQLLGRIGGKNMANMINPVWTKLCTEQDIKMTGIDLFTKNNFRRLWSSMTDQDKEYDAETNAPDMVKLVVSEGNLEPTPAVTDCTYNSNTGVVHIEWDMKCRNNGRADDYAYVMVYKMPVVDSQWRANGQIFGTAISTDKTRGDGSMEINIPKRLSASDVIGYVFFRDKAGKIGYSPSKAKTVRK